MWETITVRIEKPWSFNPDRCRSPAPVMAHGTNLSLYIALILERLDHVSLYQH